MRKLKSSVYTIENNTKSRDTQIEHNADFETAIAKTEFGKFHFLLYFVSLPAAITTQFEVTNMSYIFAPAHCDLELSLENKGQLNAITYLGICSSAFLGGFLSDKFGRRRVCTILYTMAGINVLFYSTSRAYPTLLVLKYIGGFLVGGPYSALLPYLSEFHDKTRRGKMTYVMGFFHAIGNVILPILAWAVFPIDVDFRVGNLIVIHSWNLFLLCCGIPGLLGGLMFYFMPESPKFLMTAGKNEEAIKVFQTIYSINTGLPKENYPVQSLVDEVKANGAVNEIQRKESKLQTFKRGLQLMLSVFKPPYTIKLFLGLTIQFGIMCGLNTLRLWLPELYATINEYQTTNPNSSASLCEMLEFSAYIKSENNSTVEEKCIVGQLNDVFYIRNVIVAVSAMMGSVVAVIIINRVGKKNLFVLCGICGGLSGFSLYYANTVPMIVVLSSINQSFTSVGTLTILGITVDIFPTQLRTMTVALISSSGRIGAMFGNIIFPYLLNEGCLPPFLFISAAIFASAVLVVFLPKTDMKSLE
ncbi:synaptic vesicle glycoprotein 2B [Agrilus planipennis]|uniref:Synaptic vesicle glycoprotein 2B n=1 Tax=Agrilus planipennis TaxID=224129 RepID=A0A1W4WUS5_AGRPL|nr:synaptic vesicle glycoprotein 2B [Agrilus planipennis]